MDKVIFATAVGILWIIFMVYWLIAATRVKRSVRDASLWRGGLIRVVIFVVVIVLIRKRRLGHVLAHGAIAHPAVAVIGVVLCAAGIAFAIWARVYIGRNWGVPMSRREDPELVTTGPYRYVRHPIYAGMLLAMLGTALVLGPIWWLILIWCAAYFIYSAFKEERAALQQFPGEYAEYKKRTRMFIPRVL